jgi:uncharacterized protein YndB with AHSA1/START domain
MAGVGGAVVSVSPSAVVDAPAERVWDLLTRPEGFHLWAEAAVVAAEPPGLAQAGQELHVVTRALGWTFAMTIAVQEVDEEGRRLCFEVEQPFGVHTEERVRVADAGEGRALVSYEAASSLPEGWRGALARLLLGRELRRGPAASLKRLKRMFEADS